LYVLLFASPLFHYRIQNDMPLLHIPARLSQPIFPLPTWIPNVYYHIRKAPLLVLIISAIHPVRLFLTPLFKIHFNIILPSADGSSKLSSTVKHRNHEHDLRLFFPSLQSVP